MPPYLRLDGPNQWLPDDVLPGFRRAVDELFDRLGAVAFELMEVLSVGLGLAPDHLRDVFGERPLSFAKLISYPPTPPGEAGVNAHHDAGFLTLLMQHGVGGLQVAEPRRRLDRRPAPRRRVRRQPRRDAAADDRQLLRRHDAPGHRHRGPLLVRLLPRPGPAHAARAAAARRRVRRRRRRQPAPRRRRLHGQARTSCSPARAARRRRPPTSTASSCGTTTCAATRTNVRAHYPDLAE